jgi:hypothetical protein
VSIDTSVLSISDNFGTEQIQHPAGPNTFVVSESIRLNGQTFVSGEPVIEIVGPNGNVEQVGKLNQFLSWTASKPTGRYTVQTASGDWIGGYSVVSAEGFDVPEVSGDGPATEEFVNSQEPTSGTEYALETPGVVAADDADGMADAPAPESEEVADAIDAGVDPSTVDTTTGQSGGSGGGVIGAVGVVVLVVLAAGAALLGGGD